MKALILAAGLGSRLKGNTKSIPKALVKVNGLPILHYQLNALSKANIKEICIVIGYKGFLIKDYINKNHFETFVIRYVENKKYNCSNSSYSFWLAKDFVSEGFYIHINCDIIFSQQLLDRVINSKYDNVIVTRSDLELTNNMENVIIKDNQIINMSLKNTAKANGKAFGLAKFSPTATLTHSKKLKGFINKKDLNQNYYGMIRLSVKEMNYHAIMSNQNNILEINTVEDLNTANNILGNKE